MKKGDKMKNDLSKASFILLDCTKKALVLKVCNDFAEQEEGFPKTEKQDIGMLYSGISLILYEIIEQISEAQNLIGDAESNIDGLCKPVKEVPA
jgi:hypothetical protein